jgi:hypothetical protein
MVAKSAGIGAWVTNRMGFVGPANAAEAERIKARTKQRM